MKPVFETTGTCLNIKLPEELDHPASELTERIRQDYGKNIYQNHLF